jgi:hypothetical protein
MKKLFLLTFLFLSFRIANAALYVIVVGHNPPDLTNLCLSDTIRFSGDSTGLVYGVVQCFVWNVDSLLGDPFAVLSDSNYVSTHDHILVTGDEGYLFTPQILGWGLFSFNCTSGVNMQSKSDADIFLFPNPATVQVEISSAVMMENVKVYDNFGKKIIDHRVSSTRELLDVSTLADGIYLVEIKTSSQTFFKKLSKN